MSTKADKGDRKREIEQSPMKKKFRDSAISSEDLDSAIANRIELVFKEHQSTLNSVVKSAVRDAMDSVLIPALRELREDIQATNMSVKELREEFEAIASKTKQTRDRDDSVKAAAREDKRTVTDLKDQLERLTEKMTDMEDRSRIYPAVIKLRHKGEQRSYDSPQKAEDFISSMSQQKSYAAALREDDGRAAAAVSPIRREWHDGRDGLGPSCPEGDDGRMNMDAC